MPPLIPCFLLIGQSNAYRMADHLQDEITNIYGLGAMLINAAVVGSTLEQWQPGTDNYTEAVTKTREAIGAGFRLRAILMSHGESDAHLNTARLYGDDCNNMLDNLRDDLIHVPVIYSQLGKKPDAVGADYPFWDVIRWQQQVMSFNRENYYMVRRAQYDVYEPGRPYCHDTADALKLIAREFGRYLKGWVQ